MLHTQLGTLFAGTHCCNQEKNIDSISEQHSVLTGCIVCGLRKMQTHRPEGCDLRDGHVADTPGRCALGLAPNGESESMPLLCWLCMGTGKVQHCLLLLYMTSNLDAKKQLLRCVS